MVRREQLFWAVLRVPADFTMLLAAGIAAYALRTAPWLEAWRPALFVLELPWERYVTLVVSLAAVGLCLFAVVGLYSLRRPRSVIPEIIQAASAISAGFMGLVFWIFVRGELFNSRFIFLAAWGLAVVFVVAGRALLRAGERYFLMRRGFGVRKVMVIGRDVLTERVVAFLSQNPRLGYRVVKVLGEPDISQVKRAIGNPGIQEVVLADPDYPRDKVLELVDCCNDLGLSFKFVPNLFQSLTVNVGMDLFGDVPLIELKRTRLEGWGRVAKRTLDVLGALVIGLVMVPVFAAVAFAIKWDSIGPVFERLKRVSQGRVFDLFKFRSMIKDAHRFNSYFRTHYNERLGAGPLFKMKADPRITRVGHFLRVTRLDEFAQLINVLKGEMSLVGPRPHEPEEVAQYEKHHRKVLAIKPGITGPAQVSGASDLPFEDEVRLDTYYVERWSLGLDFKILFKTLWVFVRGDQAAV